MKTNVIAYSGLKLIPIYNKIAGCFSGVSVPVYFLGLLLARAPLPGGLLPAGIAMFFASSGRIAKRLPLSLMVIGGMLTAGSLEQAFLAGISMVLFSVLVLLQKDCKSAGKLAVTAFASVMLPQILYAFTTGGLFFDILKSLLYSGTVSLLSVVFLSAVGAESKMKRGGYRLNNEEAIGLSVLFMLCLSGVPSIHIFGIDPKSVICFFAILLLGYKCGPGVGTVGGVAFGIMLNVSGGIDAPFAGAYAFLGLLAGIFARLGKTGAVLGFLLANTVLALYISNTQNILLYIKEMIVAVFAFLALPSQWMGFLSEMVGSNACTQAHSTGDKHVTDFTVSRLNQFSTAVKELSHAFVGASKPCDARDKGEMAALFDRVADRVCKDCKNSTNCWDKKFHTTYQAFFDIAEGGGDGSQKFNFVCEKEGELIGEINNGYEILKSDVRWKNRIGESRAVVSRQLDSLSKVISGLADEIGFGQGFNSDIKKELEEELRDLGVYINDVVVHENKDRRSEIVIVHRGCDVERNCEGSIQKAVSNVMSKKMVKLHQGCEREQASGICRLRMVEDRPYRVMTGISKVPKYGLKVSGDCYTFLNTDDGKHVIAISDGMGCGAEALEQSKAAIELLEGFFESGFDRETTIDIINSSLLLNSGNDSFATIDLCSLDLYNGRTEFVKVGAAPGFIKRKLRVETVKHATIPAGILDDIEVETSKKTLTDGDLIIMMTDGVFDALKLGLGNEGMTITSFLKQIPNNTNPQEAADIILGKACEICGSQPFDDMTVVVTEVMHRG